MNKHNYKIQKYKGSKLLEFDFKMDSFKQPINPDIMYRVKYYPDNKSMDILAEDEWEKQEAYELFDTIKKSGVISWYNFGARLGFFEPGPDETTADVKKDIIKRLDKMIAIFNIYEDYEMSGYIRDAIEELKNYKD